MATPWIVPRMWSGKTVAILASGPSMSAEIAQKVRESGLPTIVTNNTHELAPWADVLYAADCHWWRHYPDALEFAGIKVTADERTSDQRVNLLRRTGTDGYDPEPGNVRTGGNTGYQCIHLAMQASAARILLFGFDMRGSHWHGPHRGLRNTNDHTFGMWVKRFPALSKAAEKIGCDVVNCTPWSAITCFRTGDDSCLSPQA